MTERVPGRAIIGVALTLQAVTAAAGVDQPWNEPVDGGGGLSSIALWFGVAAAVYVAFNEFRCGSSFGESLLAAYYGLIFGLVLGLPVSCVLK